MYISKWTEKILCFLKKTTRNHIAMIDLYLNLNKFFGYEDSYNFYDIDVHKILLLRKSGMEYFIRNNDVNKKKLCHNK